MVPGEQSVLYPNAIPGLVVPGDPGIPSTLSPTQYNNFAPRIGLAYSPNFHDGIGKKSSASVARAVSARATACSTPIFRAQRRHHVWRSAVRLQLSQPRAAAAGDSVRQRLRRRAEHRSVSAELSSAQRFGRQSQHGFNFASVTPISADPYCYYRNMVPYTENYMFSIQRQIHAGALLTVSYVGNQGHHLLENLPTNVGNPALCLSLSQPSQVAQGTSHLRPFPGSGTFTSASGAGLQRHARGIRAELRHGDAQQTIGNSDYNALEANLRLAIGKRATVLFGYTYSKSMDQASNIGEVLNPANYKASHASFRLAI